MTESPNLLIEVKNVNLSFVAHIYQARSWRDAFVSFTSAPVDFLVRSRDRIHVAKDISFEVRRGDRIGILGVNGAGKTSLCRCIAGMYFPNSGTIKKFGKIRAIFEPGIGVVPELTGRENVELLAELMFPGEPNQSEMVEEALTFSELGEFLDLPYKYYSKGMQARLCLSLVSARACDVIILDEVFDGADMFFKDKLARRVLNMIQQSGAALFVSHSPDQVLQVCNRVILLHHGKLLFDGDVKEGVEAYSRLVPNTVMKVEN